MRHLNFDRRGALAAAASAALVLAACAPDDDTPDGDVEPVEPADEADEVAFPDGVFGPACQELLTAADLPADAAPGADVGAGATEEPQDDPGVGTDDPATGAEDPADEPATGDDGDGGLDEEVDDDAMLEDDADDGQAAAARTISVDTDTDTDADAGAEADAEASIDGTDDPAGDGTTGPQGELGDEQPLAELSLREAVEALPGLATLAGELTTAQLDAELEGGQVTLFAPFDPAFDRTGAGSDVDVEADADTDTGDDAQASAEADVEATTSTVDLRLHLTDEGALRAQQLVDQGTVTTLADSTPAGAPATEDDATDEPATDGEASTEADRVELTVDVTGETVTVTSGGTSAQVVCANIETADGVIHVLDQVLEAEPTDDGEATQDAPDEATTDGEAPDDATTDDAVDGEDGI